MLESIDLKYDAQIDSIDYSECQPIHSGLFA